MLPRKLARKHLAVPYSDVELAAALRRVADLLDEVERTRQSLKLLPRARTRLDRSGSRPRKFVARALSNIMSATYGVWFSDEIAILTEIATPGREIYAEHVRSVRRPTTRKARRRISAL